MNDPELFLVRIWRQLAEGFHASVRRVDAEETRHFSRPDEVTRFLCGAVSNANPADAPPCAAAPAPAQEERS